MAVRESDVVLLSACRTPIGRYLGGLAPLSAVELGTIAARAALERAGLAAGDVDEAIVGNVLSAGLGQAPARQVARGAGIPDTASALTVNMVCGSGLRAAMLGASAIRAGDARVILAGGMESMSNAPHLLRQGRTGWKIGDQPLIDSMMSDGLTCSAERWPMGMAAELTATQCGLTRPELDAFAYESHRRAVAAQGTGAFDAEIVAVPVAGPKGQVTDVRADENPRADSSPEKLAKLPPAFRSDGVVTAGNASGLSDGAAMVTLALAGRAHGLGIKPLARVRGYAVAGRAPRDLFLAPIDAVRAAVEKADIRLTDIDLCEINEAFASQMLGCMRGLELDPARVNVHGGAIALGHPIGASGTRVLVTLVHALERHDKTLGLAALCLGGGNAVAMVIERL